MNKLIIIIGSGFFIAILAMILVYPIFEYTQTLKFFYALKEVNYTKDPYILEKIKDLKEMPCSEMSEKHFHEIKQQDHFSAYDEKYRKCFGMIP